MFWRLLISTIIAILPAISTAGCVQSDVIILKDEQLHSPVTRSVSDIVTKSQVLVSLTMTSSSQHTCR